jgi:hypothetical protein
MEPQRELPPPPPAFHRCQDAMVVRCGRPGAGGDEADPPPPDVGACLLHQKLQMIDVCIARRRQSQPPLSLRERPEGDAGVATAPPPGPLGRALPGGAAGSFRSAGSGGDPEADGWEGSDLEMPDLPASSDLPPSGDARSALRPAMASLRKCARAPLPQLAGDALRARPGWMHACAQPLFRRRCPFQAHLRIAWCKRGLSMCWCKTRVRRPPPELPRGSLGERAAGEGGDDKEEGGRWEPMEAATSGGDRRRAAPEPRGVAGVMPGEFLSAGGGRRTPLRVPLTQMAPVATEDMMLERQMTLASMGAGLSVASMFAGLSVASTGAGAALGRWPAYLRRMAARIGHFSLFGSH